MTVLGRMTYRPQPEAKLVQKGVHVIMLMRPLNWWGWEVVFVTGTLIHFWSWNTGAVG